MMNRTPTGMVLFVLVLGLAGCGDSGLQSTTPSPVPAPPVPVQNPPFPILNLTDATLSGLVFEETPNGRAPLEGAWVYCEPCGAETHMGVYTDSKGLYSFSGVWTNGHFPTRIWITKEGYADPEGLPTPTPPNPSGPGWREVVVNGDTQFDARLVRVKG